MMRHLMENARDLDLSGGIIFMDIDSIGRCDIDFSKLESIVSPLFIYPNISEREIGTKHRNAWCVIVNKVKLTRNFFMSRPDLKLVCIIATGINNVDVKAAEDFGVSVMNCRGYSTEAVAQHTVMLMLNLFRNFVAYQRDLTNGNWSRSPFFCLLNHPIREAHGLKLGIVGFGEIGRRVSELARSLGMDVIISERPGSKVRSGRMPFHDTLSECDVISLHCPLTQENKHIIDQRALRLMRRDAIIINTSRGALIDEWALLEALSGKIIGGAGIDVLDQEPPAFNHPLLKANLTNLIITPHNAWGSRDARQCAVDQTVENIKAWLNRSGDRYVFS